MAEPILSPDGNFIWNGTEWIPYQKIQDNNVIQDSAVAGDVISNVNIGSSDSDVIRAAMDGIVASIKELNKPTVIKSEFNQIKTPKKRITKRKSSVHIFCIIILLSSVILGFTAYYSSAWAVNEGSYDSSGIETTNYGLREGFQDTEFDGSSTFEYDDSDCGDSDVCNDIVDSGYYGNMLLLCSLILSMVCIVFTTLNKFDIVKGNGDIFLMFGSGALFIASTIIWSMMFPWDDIGAKADDRNFEYGSAFFMACLAGFMSLLSGIILRFSPKSKFLF
jgi:hypothetical protein